MTEVTSDELKLAIENHHGGLATFAQSVPVTETQKRRTENEGMTFIRDEVVWDGIVYIFDLAGHPNASRAYAWAMPIEGSTDKRLCAVLHLGGITGPSEAVRATIVAEQRRDPAKNSTL